MADDTSRIRVVLQQPCLTKYRVPVFRELARRPGIDLLVVYGSEAGITNVEPDGFTGQYIPLHDWKLGPVLLRYHAAQFLYSTRAKADVVVLSWSSRYLSLLPGLVRARWSGVGIVLWGHGYSKAETGFRWAARVRLSTLSDSVMFYNNAAAQQFVEAGSGSPERVFVALNTIDLDPVRQATAAWRRDPQALADFRRDRGLDPGPVVLFVSRLYASNRVDVLIRAAAEIRPRFPGLRVLIVGDGPDAPRLRALAEKLGVADAICFVGPVFAEHDLAPYFLASDVYCYPSNIGLSIIHALGYGLPIVTSSNHAGHNPEIEAFREGVNGVSFADGDPNALAAALTTVLGDHDLRRRLRNGAAATVDHDYLIEKMVDGMEAAIRTAHVRHLPA